jgi:ribosome assembly protein RRB1
VYFVAGSQAETEDDNRITLIKCSHLSRTRYDEDPDDSDREDDEDDDEDAEDALIESKTVQHRGCINRIRSMPQNPGIVATWSEHGLVSIFDLSQHLRALDVAPSQRLPTAAPAVFVSTNFGAEGFALDWNSHSAAQGVLAAGSCNGTVSVFVPAQGGSAWAPSAFTASCGKNNSVEDVQWSPTEPTVFVAACVDGGLRVFDTRQQGAAALSLERAHDADVNVVSWNRNAAHLLASGGDDGVFRVWDLRAFKTGAYAASLNFHRGPITSVEWHPQESSVLAVSGDDDQITLWDLSVERDDDNQVKAGGNGKGQEEEEVRVQGMRLVGSDGDEDVRDVPPQLMFVHMGQSQIKEIHWHPQIPGVLMSTAGDGFNIFKTCNM